jgi:hypothetical protein
MIVGELIGFITMCMFWALFIIGVFGLVHEFSKGYLEENAGLITLHLLFTFFGLAFGIIGLFWFFNITGIGEILANMFNGWWTTKL